MDNLICRKVVSMLSSYIENKLSDDERFFVENHFSHCKKCRKKFYEMSEIFDSLHFEYEKMLKEFDKIEQNKSINIKEYELFYDNISPYVDDELNYDESLKFRRYLLKSKSARDELSNTYNLRKNIKKSAENFMDKTHLNFSKKVIKKLKNENKKSNPTIYKKVAIIIGFIVSTLTLAAIFIGLNYFNQSYADINVIEHTTQNFSFPNDEDWIEFYFDEYGNSLLAAK